MWGFGVLGGRVGAMHCSGERDVPLWAAAFSIGMTWRRAAATAMVPSVGASGCAMACLLVVHPRRQARCASGWRMAGQCRALCSGRRTASSCDMPSGDNSGVTRLCNRGKPRGSGPRQFPPV